MEKSRSSITLKEDELKLRVSQREVWLASRGEKLRFIQAIEQYQHPKKRLKLNILALLSTTIGMGVGTIFVIFLVALILNAFISLPLIGESINTLLEWIERFKTVRG
ncbi:DUF5665 domain-containing protein [Aneurinibacillus migulanus]|uniref:DUF5665 domain-containing protein n=1 Tax=Aneurinibacillus migulanus TaxID=47500 RepID=UPI002E20CED3|nr:DUF5665 domain-containing protein [Aneurinibacillus migulanus]